MFYWTVTLLLRMSDKGIMGWKKFQAGLSQMFPSLLVGSLPKVHLRILEFISVMPLLSERPDRNSASISNTSRPIHLPAPYCLVETSVECSQMLLVALHREINLPRCCSHRGQVVGMTPFLPAPMDIQGRCMCFTQGGEEQEAMENECKLCSL